MYIRTCLQSKEKHVTFWYAESYPGWPAATRRNRRKVTRFIPSIRTAKRYILIRLNVNVILNYNKDIFVFQ